VIRLLSAALGALQSLVLVAIVAVPGLLIGSLVWAVDFGMAGEWGWSYRAAAGFWLLGHGVPIEVTLDPAWVASLGLPESASALVLSLPPIGVALVTAVFAFAGGRRLTELAYPGWGLVGGVAAAGALAALLAWSASTEAAAANPVRAALQVAFLFLVFLALGMRSEQVSAELPQGRVSTWVSEQLDRQVVRNLALALRAAVGVAMVMLIAGAALTLFALVTGYARVMTMYQSLHAGVLGGLAVTLVQAALMPAVTVWSAAWLAGPGFVVGTGSAVSPFGTALGPLPALPIFGALPEQAPTLGFAGLLVPVLAGFVGAALLRRRLVGEVESVPGRIGLGALIGLCSGLVMAVVAALASGSIGPGRLAEVGPEPVSVFLAVTVLAGVGAIVALAAPLRERRSETEESFAAR